MKDITNDLLRIQAMIIAAERAFSCVDGTSDELDNLLFSAADMWYQEAINSIQPLRKEHADDPRVLVLERHLHSLRCEVDTDYINEQLELE
jgi:hypothetical protein